MNLLDWLFIGLLSAALLCALFFLVVLIQRVVTGRKRSALEKRRVKNKRKRKKIKRQIHQLKKAQRNQLRNALMLLLLGAALGGGAYYSLYYRSHTLDSQDSEGIVQGYHLIAAIEEKLDSDEATTNPKKTANTVKEMSGRLSSYGTRVASQRLTLEGQGLLNRQFTAMKELGINLYSQKEEFLSDPEQLATVKEDLEKVRAQQKKVFDYFNINEASLQKKN